MKTRIVALALLTLGSFAPVGLAGERWYEEFDAAAAAAKESGKDLLVDFTGSDWCGWCIRLHDEVFGEDAFVLGTQRDFVLVSLDLPRKEQALSRVPDLAQNKELQKKYGVRGFPTVLLMSAEGEVYARTGYQKGGVDPYLAHLAELRVKHRPPLAAAELVEGEFEGAPDERKLEIFEQFVPVLAALDVESAFAVRIAPAARWAVAVDPANTRGLRMRGLRALLDSGVADAGDIEMARELDPENAAGLLEASVMAEFRKVRDEAGALLALAALDALEPHGFRERALGFELLFLAARWCDGPLADPERRKAYATKAQEVGTDDARLRTVLAAMLAK